MYSVFASLAAAIAAAILLKATGLVRSNWGLIFPSVLAFLVTALLVMRWAGAKLEPMLKGVEKHLMGGRRELALSGLRDGLVLGRWNPLVPPQLRAQIGMLEYVMGNLDAAKTELESATRWPLQPWQSKAYLGCVYYKRKDEAGMRKAFEGAIKTAEKEPLAYTVYAYCLLGLNQKAEGVKVLERAVAKMPSNERLQGNLELAKEGKRLKTQNYGDQWTAFALDSGEGPAVPKAARGFAVRPGFRQRPMRKKK